MSSSVAKPPITNYEVLPEERDLELLQRYLIRFQRCMIEVINIIHHYVKIPQKYSFGLKGVRLCINPGEVLVIHGARGSGKTTLMRIMLGLMQPVRGQVLYDLHLIKKRLGTALIRYVPQKDGLYMKCTIAENVKFFGRLCSWNNIEIRSLTKYIIYRIGSSKSKLLLEDIDPNLVTLLSFFIARMAEPDILFIDDITTAYDQTLKDIIWAEIKQMRRLNKKVTIILTTSEFDEAKDGLGATRVAHLRYGQIIETGPPINFKKLSANLDLKPKAPEEKKKKKKEPPPDLFMPSFYRSALWTMPKDKMKKQFDELHECSAPFVDIFCCLLWEKIKLMRQSFIMYLLVLFIMPNLILVAFCYGLGHDVDNLQIGLRQCKTCSSNQTNQSMSFFTPYCELHKNVSRTFNRIKEYQNEEEMMQDLYSDTVKATFSYAAEGNSEIEELMSEFCGFKPSKAINESLSVDYKTLPGVVKVDAGYRSLVYLIHDMLRNLQESLEKRFTRWRKSKFLRKKDQDKDKIFSIEHAFKRTKLETHFVIWGVLPLIIFHCGVLIGILPFSHHRERGVFDRLRVIGIKFWHFETPKLFDIFLLFLATISLIITIRYIGAFDYEPAEKVVIILFFFGICGMTFGMFLATIYSENFLFINIIMVTLDFCALTLAGSLWPQEGLEGFYLYASMVLPHTHVVEGVQGVALKGFGLINFIVLKAIGYPMVWTLINYCAYCYKAKENWK